MLAGLLHDIGHGPFSHIWEQIFPEFDHEEMTHNILQKKGYTKVVDILKKKHPFWQLITSTIDMGFRRLRLMSYWNIHEKTKGSYDFTELDKQVALLSKSGCRATLAIGMRQPRWPETHVPDWTKGMKSTAVEEAYMKFHVAIIERYRDNPVIESWQLENEFWLRSFGVSFDFSRVRLKREFATIRALDPHKPIIMSVAHFGSLPLRGPKPDIYATSMYRVIYQHDSKTYSITKIPPWQYRIKRWAIRLLRKRDLIVHELQAEPWGPKANWEMSKQEQFKSIDARQVQEAVVYARASGIAYIDMWGAEWWYWRKTHHKDPELTRTVADLVKNNE